MFLAMTEINSIELICLSQIAGVKPNEGYGLPIYFLLTSRAFRFRENAAILVAEDDPSFFDAMRRGF